MHCTNCGAGVGPGANFCRQRCGSQLTSPSGVRGVPGARPSRCGPVCAGLVSDLDSAREGWLSLVNDVMSSSPAVSIIS